MERSDQGFCTAWVVLAELAGLKVVMGDIATSATRNLDLSEKACGLFHDEGGATAIFSVSDGAEKSGGASSYYDKIPDRMKMPAFGYRTSSL